MKHAIQYKSTFSHQSQALALPLLSKMQEQSAQKVVSKSWDKASFEHFLTKQKKTNLKSAAPKSISQTKVMLLEKIHAFFNAWRKTEFQPKQSHIVRFSIPIQSIDLLGWLQQQSDPVRLYFSSKSANCSQDASAKVMDVQGHPFENFSMAAIGEADQISADSTKELSQIFEKIKSKLQHSNDLSIRYFGGFRFDPKREIEAGWQEFGIAKFILPRVAIEQGKQSTTLHYHLVFDAHTTSSSLLQQSIRDIESIQFTEKPSSSRNIKQKFDSSFQSEQPIYEDWENRIKQTQELLEKGKLEKLVLARQSHLALSQDIDPIAILKSLLHQAVDTTHFYFQPAPQTAFFGATPEHLFVRKQDVIYTEALAGTRPRGKTLQEDRELAEELSASEKERQEHQLVLTELQALFAPISQELQLKEPFSVRKLQNVQHLWSRIEGRLQKHIDDRYLIETLHPTPAVGGRPKSLSLQYLRELEHFDRGWYAAPFGWLSTESAEFTVAIRSALLTGSWLTLYAGAGIVKASEPKAEWQELTHKLKPFLDCLQASNSQQAFRS